MLKKSTDLSLNNVGMVVQLKGTRLSKSYIKRGISSYLINKIYHHKKVNVGCMINHIESYQICQTPSGYDNFI